MTKKHLLLAAFAVLTMSWSTQAKTQTAEITYIANEGFLIATGTHKILIDALFDDR